ncbi:uncharacterized protein H6S33_011434 [Morchella sextelata]|uniref:uncharacterized protein n=1 Tax=Morchella sextelata TaxID=1174677 RepID=UPI001D0385CE|nr:uncharacterized protein H6S33_011434 [Morchella sextelata]KAH0611007.1 hypothetical protein H6S33_011434 [Morchella sextelata]
MQFSTILIATAALAMTVIAAPVAGDEGHGTQIHDSGNVGDVSQSGNHNVCSNQNDRTTQVCCNKSNKAEASGLVAANVLSNLDLLDLGCAIASNCKVEQNAYCCKQDNKSNGINLVQLNSCGPLVDVL